MLTFHEFNKLPEQDQYAYVWHKCQFLVSYVEDEMFYANLYHAGTFFIEVWYNTAENKIDSLLTFKNRHKLEPYLAMIDIQSLLH